MITKTTQNDRPVIVFGYGLDEVGLALQKETTMIAGNLLDTAGVIPRGAIFTYPEDKAWLDVEINKAVMNMGWHLVRLQHGLDENVPILATDVTYSFVINDYNAYTPTLPEWFDKAIFQSLVLALCSTWYKERNYGDLLRFCEAEREAVNTKIYLRHNEFFKRKKTLFTCKPSEGQPGFIAQGMVYFGIVTGQRPLEVNIGLLSGKQVSDVTDYFSIEYAPLVGWHILAIPSDFSVRQSWLVDDFNKGVIGGPWNDPQSNTFPAPIMQEYQGRNYQVYVSSFETQFMDEVKFSKKSFK